MDHRLRLILICALLSVSLDCPGFSPDYIYALTLDGCGGQPTNAVRYVARHTTAHSEGVDCLPGYFENTYTRDYEGLWFYGGDYAITNWSLVNGTNFVTPYYPWGPDPSVGFPSIQCGTYWGLYSEDVNKHIRGEALPEDTTVTGQHNGVRP